LWEKQIHADQIGFVGGKWIQQHTITLQAALASFKDNKKGGCLFIDLKNAYPTMRFNWLKKAVEDRGGQSMRKLVNMMLGGKARVLYKGRIGKSFRIKRGVKQGDVASAFLFNLGLDPILKEIPVKELFGNHYKLLAYADDLIIFVEDEKELRAF